MANNTVSGLDSIISQSSTIKTTATKILGKDDFMKLLLAQLKNQDPLKPLDGTDFAAQLAQFSSLEQLSNMNAELKNFSVNQMTMNYAQSVNLIGKNVVTSSGNSLTVNSSSTDLNYQLAKDAQSVTITILDKSGKLVETWNETDQKAGANKVKWDTSKVEKGDYTFQVTAKDSQGQTISVNTLTSGLVTAVHFRNNQILATVNGNEVPISDIIEVNQPVMPVEAFNNLNSADITAQKVIETIKSGNS